MHKELLNDKADIWGYADGPVGEALELVGGAIGALESMSIVLEHIGAVKRAPASTYGVTPLMSP